MSDQSELIVRRNTLSANIATPATSLLYLHTHRSIWKAILDWDSINLCYNKGQRLGVSSTQLRSRGMIDVRLHSTSAWKEALSKQIACNQNIFCVSNCPKNPKIFWKHEMMFAQDYKVPLLSARSELECVCIVVCWWIE